MSRRPFRFHFDGRRQALAVGLAVLCAFAQSAPPAWAWGRAGHRAASKLAEARLTETARAQVRDLLEPGESLADASTWADEMRRDNPETGPWHYVNTPIDETDHFDVKYCPPEGCVVWAIAEQRKKLADRSLPRAERQKALRFVVHFVEDLHQPVHVGDRKDRGGNNLQVQFFGEGSNLHRVWDSGVLGRVSQDEDALRAEIERLATPEKTRQWAQGAATAWADESFQYAKLAYKPPGRMAPLKSGAKLDDDYQRFAAPIAKLRLAQAAIRVSYVLNETLKDDSR
jgi:nuclease S1